MSDSRARVSGLRIWTGAVKVEPLKGGLSNESFTAEDDTGKYVVRLGDDVPVHHVFRERECMTSRAAHAAGFAPELFHAEPGAMVFRFVTGKTYRAEDVQANIARLAGFMRRFHREMPAYVRGPAAYFSPFHYVRDYAATMAAGGSRFVPDLERFQTLSDSFEQAQVPLRPVFGHHDWLPANVIDDGNRLWLIDFEYAAFSTPMFDLANLASNARFTAAQDRILLNHYFGFEATGAQVRAHAAMKCASLLREAMWSMVSELHLNAPGVDYAAYSDEILQEFERSLAAYQTQFGRIAA